LSLATSAHIFQDFVLLRKELCDGSFDVPPIGSKIFLGLDNQALKLSSHIMHRSRKKLTSDAGVPVIAQN
jgi:hypothetical protein